jgi:hypothetical protein
MILFVNPCKYSPRIGLKERERERESERERERERERDDKVMRD